MYSSILYYSGILHVIRKLGGEKSIILAYHRVLPQGSEDIQYIQPGMFVTVKSFEMHMAYIYKHYKTVALEDLIMCPNMKRTCSVTFDDGWYDNYKYAFPILKKYNIPSTIFLSTSYIGSSKTAWPDRLAYYIHKIPNNQLNRIYQIIKHEKLQDKILEYENRLKLNRHKKELFIEILIEYMKMQDEQTISSIMSSIDLQFENLKTEFEARSHWLTWENIREMSFHSTAFGAHTHNHIILTKASQDYALKEINDSRDELAMHLGHPIKIFSYPNGEYNDSLIKIIKTSGFKMAVTTNKGVVTNSNSPFAMNRILIHDDIASTLPLFVTRITK